jgi:hypothetical protein
MGGILLMSNKVKQYIREDLEKSLTHTNPRPVTPKPLRSSNTQNSNQTNQSNQQQNQNNSNQ